MRNLSRINPRGLKEIKGKTQNNFESREEIDELGLLSRIDGMSNGNDQNDQENVLKILFDADEILATTKRSGERAKRVANAIGAKIFAASLSFGENCAVRIATLRILSHLCDASEKWAVKMLQQNIDLNLLRALHVREVSPVERHESLHLIGAMFSALSAQSVSVLVGWWRFRLFANNALHFLIDAAAIGEGISSAEEFSPKNAQNFEEDKVPNTESRKYFAIASTILLELLARFPQMFFALGVGLGWLSRLMHKCFETDNVQLARIGAQLLANLMDCPGVRREGELHLLAQQIFAPLLDTCILSSSSTTTTQQQQFSENALRRMLQLCANCFADLLHTWPGFFVGFSVDNFRHSTCQSVIAFLKNPSYLAQQHEKKLLGVELFSRMLCLPYANKELATWDEAIRFYERSHGPDPFQISLSERFVLAELPFIRPLIKTEKADLFSICQSVHVFALFHSGLPEALIRTAIRCPDNPCAIKATLLLADIFHITTVHLPRELRLKAHGIAGLINRVAHAFQPVQLDEENCDEKMKHDELDWTNSNANCSNAIKLYARLEQIERIHAHSNDEKLDEMHTFLIPNLGNNGGKGQRRRSSEHSMPSRHSSKASSSGQTTPGGPRVDEQLNKGGTTKDEIGECLAILDDLLPKAFVDAAQQTPPQLCSPTSNQQNTGEGHDKRPAVAQWPVIWHILHTFGNNLSGKTVDKCIQLFDRLVLHFLPSNRQFLRRDIAPLSVACAQQCFRLLCVCAHSSASVGLDNSQWAAQQVASFLLNFCAQLQIMEQIESVFCSRYPLHHGVRYYFAILRVLFSHSAGQKLLEQTAINQFLYELALKPSTSNSLIKLIIVSLEYFPSGETDDGQQGIFARGLFEAVLLHSTLNESIQKWATRFLDVFISLEQLGHLPTFPCWHWALSLAFRQLFNPSLKIVRCAAKLLLDWFPKCPPEARKTALLLLRTSNLNALGNLGTLLEQFNLCFVDIMEERIRKSLFLNNAETFQNKRSMDGHFARVSSNYESGKCRPCLFSPEHLYGQLIRTQTGQSLLQSECAVDDIIKTLRSFLIGKEICQKQIKSSLFALAHLLANSDPFRAHLFSFDLAASSSAVCRFPIVQLVRLLCDCVHQQRSLCVRGFALWAANIAASGNGRVAEILAAFGWQCGENAENFVCYSPTENILKNGTKIAKWDGTGKLLDDQSNRYFNEIIKCQIPNDKQLEHRQRIRTEFPRKNCKKPRNFPRIFRSVSLSDFPSYSQANKLKLKSFVRARQKSFDQLHLGEQIPPIVSSERWAESISSRKTIAYTSSVIDELLCQREMPKNVENSKATGNGSDEEQFMSEKEHGALIAYRRFLVKAGEINEYDTNASNSKTSNSRKNSAEIQMKTPAANGKGRNGIFIPNFCTIFGKISLENSEEKQCSSAAENCQNKIQHHKWRCVFCANESHEKWEEKTVIYSGAKFEVISLIDRLANAEIGTANANKKMAKLLRLFADDPTLFRDRCLFSDALKIISDSKSLSFDLRCTIFELFAHTF
ncbi:hypothetical protein niasHT_020445 [Heterodera trifolii]|uniref:Uncharacterized protein n=1 Tax=Heterodera trifolii TaxID=157864 RepID=A0ABD2JGC0_9BILA